MKRQLSLALTASALLLSRAAHAQTEETPPTEPPPLPAEPAPPPAPEPPAPAAEPPPRQPSFGAAGQWFFSSGISIGVRNSSFDNTAGSTTSVTFSPGFDYFVTKHVSFGLDLDVSYAHSGALESSQVGGGPRIGVAIPLSSHLSIYPRFTMGGRASWLTRSKTANTTEDKEDSAALFVNLFAPFLLEVAPRFFFGLGPGISRTFGDSPDVTDIYGRFVVGMALGGPKDENAAPEPESSDRFGERKSIVITGQANSAVSVAIDTSAHSTTSIALRPGFDYFVARQLSMGAFIDYVQTNSGSTTTRQLSAGPRVGYELPLGKHASLWPRADLSVGRLTTDSENRGSYAFVPASGEVIVVPSTHATALSVGLDAPVLLHFASHAFMGFGPFVRREVWRHYDGVSGSGNANTSVGLDFVLGGWR